MSYLLDSFLKLIITYYTHVSLLRPVTVSCLIFETYNCVLRMGTYNRVPLVGTYNCVPLVGTLIEFLSCEPINALLSWKLIT